MRHGKRSIEAATSGRGRCANIIRLNAKSTCGIVYTPWRVAYGASGYVLVNEVHESSTYVRKANIINVARPASAVPGDNVYNRRSCS